MSPTGTSACGSPCRGCFFLCSFVLAFHSIKHVRRFEKTKRREKKVSLTPNCEKSVTKRQAKRGFFAKSVSICHFYEPLHLLKPLSFFVSQGGFCRALKIFSQICHKVLTFARNRTIMKTTFFEIEKSCLRSVGIRRKGAAARAS